MSNLSGPQAYGRFEPYAPAPSPEPSQVMARWALGLSLVPCGLLWLVGAGLGIATLVKGRDGRDHGRKKAIAAIVVAVLWICALVVLVVVNPFGADRDADGDVVSAGDVQVTDLRVGDCLVDALDEGESTTVAVTPCDTPHRTEVYAEFDLRGSRYPGDAEAARLAEGGCSKRTPDAVTQGLDAGELELFYLYPPTARDYDADRTVSCLIVSARPRSTSVLGPD